VPGFVDYSDTALKYDLDAAKQILEDAGWTEGDDGIREKDGQKLELKATSNILVPNARVTYEATQAALKQIGIAVDILFDTTNIPTTQINAEYHLINRNTSRNDPAALNVAFNPDYNNGSQIPADSPDRERIVSTLIAIESTLDTTERAGYTKAALDLIHDELALYNPVFIPSQVAATKTVQGIELDATSRLVFLKTWLGG
jgi:peptide/nickel transport system substrate-binding protein